MRAEDTAAKRVTLMSRPRSSGRRRWVVFQSGAHAAADRHDPQEAAGVIDQIVVHAGAGDRRVQVGGGGYLTGEVTVEVVAVAGVAQQLRPGDGGPPAAQRLDDVDPPPAGDPVGQPDQRSRTATAALQCLRGQRGELVRQQPDGLDQRDGGSPSG
ncbi:hypothetical protein [Actinoplanes sp. G11-F43]|uniref:hypothetical protein n=1 Tax=Actinoplanes sp. G11-F43 TaxID=3424130 RepID=UPI003D340281